MPSTDLLGIALALTSALVWGGGDFSGGYASRRSSPFQVLALSALSGILGLGVAAVLSGEGLPSAAGAGWAGLAGLSGALGLACLYRALSMGRAASAAPTAAVIGAVLPVILSVFTSGLPGPARLGGFGLAFAGIWLVSLGAGGEGPEDGAKSSQAFGLACLAGLGFGAFFIFIAQVEPDRVFSGLIVARSLTFLVALILLRTSRQRMITPAANPVAFLAGFLDAGGNVFFLLAKQFTGLGTAAVLSSLYPASTVLLSVILFKERISARQGLGVLLCLGAIILITV